MKPTVLVIIAIIFSIQAPAQTKVKLWDKYEYVFTSAKTYENPIYNVKSFDITFSSPTERQHRVYGFWDGGTSWKVRFMPDETGSWSWNSVCSDQGNSGLHNQSGNFECILNESQLTIYHRGAIQHPKGKYYLSHRDGTPFFWSACTAWNGALKSTDDEWQTYLAHRRDHHYNVIQLVTTQWRGADQNAEGMVAYEGSGEITINPEFFERMDRKIDEVNRFGLVVSPVILWALPTGAGRYLSPGYHLPVDEAVLLARYIVARYQGNHVVWTLGGDGRYYDELESRWKKIGGGVFNGIDHAPVTLHPHGSSYVGNIYACEPWYSLMSYQSSHSNGERVVNWINKGPMANEWDKLKPMPYINMEPNYEEINFSITAEDVRNASWWSIFATPIAGITYGANGIWPWLREGESILNHRDAPGTSTWRKSIDFPGSIQIGYLSEFIQQTDWWNFFPAKELLVSQPGDVTFNAFVSVVARSDRSGIMAYIPKPCTIELRNPLGLTYEAQWYNPQTNMYKKADFKAEDGKLIFAQKEPSDMVLKIIAK
jgi:hypothetical protein